MIDEQNTYDLESIPDDAVVNSGGQKEFTPLDPLKYYQVEVVKAELRDNPYYNPKETDPAKKGSKYQIGFEFAILNDEDFYGRRLWKNTSLAFMPNTRRGEPSILYKIINSALDMKLDWDGCASFAPDTKTLMENIEKDVIGSQLIVGIENYENTKGKVRSKIISYNPIKKALPGFNQEKSSEKAEEIKESKNVDVPNLNETLDDFDQEDFEKFLEDNLDDKKKKTTKKKKGK